MKTITITKYKCDICGAEYESGKECEMCEKHHEVGTITKVSFIERAWHPKTLCVSFSNGDELVYHYHGPMGIYEKINGDEEFIKADFREREE